MDTRPIGIFDSGLGGVSTLRQALHLLPDEAFVYYGDNGNAPYGSRSEDDIRILSQNAVRFLISKNAKAILLACNTSTAAAFEMLQRISPVPVIGIEPAILEASQLAGSGRILMMSTQATARLPRYHRLRERLPDPSRVIDIPCSAQFVWRVEHGVSSMDGYDDLFEAALAPCHGEQVDAIVLGCTHYLFFQLQLVRYAQKHFHGVPRFFDGGRAAAQALLRTLKDSGALNPDGQGDVTFFTSGDYDTYHARFETLLRQPMHIDGIEL
jgi:glutamate racemase